MTRGAGQRVRHLAVLGQHGGGALGRVSDLLERDEI